MTSRGLHFWLRHVGLVNPPVVNMILTMAFIMSLVPHFDALLSSSSKRITHMCQTQITCQIAGDWARASLWTVLAYQTTHPWSFLGSVLKDIALLNDKIL